jgi:hypothetical protein
MPTHDNNSKRSCGECTLCCKVIGVHELKKNPGVWCKYCNIGEGGGVYKDRPSSCAEFRCLWLDSPCLPDELRPDRIGACFAGIGYTHLIAWVDSTSPMTPLARRFITFLTHKMRKPVIISDGGTPYAEVPPGHGKIEIEEKDKFFGKDEHRQTELVIIESATLHG